MSSIARSSICDMEDRHCAGAAMHAQLGTTRDRKPMDTGTAFHHLIFAVTMREDGQLADEMIDQTAVELVANGRSFDGGPVEHLRLSDVDAARDYALNFLDRDFIPERGGVEWMEAEVLVAFDRFFKRCDRDMCACGHLLSAHATREAPCGACRCAGFRPIAIWQQAIDLACICQDEIDEEEVKVVEVTDYKGGNCSNGWFTSIQGKAAAVSAVALCPDADIVRRRVISYMPWGGNFTNDLDLRQQEDVDTLEDCQRAVAVAAEGHRRRQGKTPDELAQPGAGCSGGFGGCPFLLVCRPFAKAWRATEAAFEVGLVAGDAQFWASQYVIAHAAKQEANRRVKASMVDTGQVITLDGNSVVGWKEKKGTKIAPNAAMLLAEQWVHVMLKLEPGSPAAQLEQSRFEAILMNALPEKGGATLVKNLVKRLKEIIGYEEAAALEALCLVDDPGRQLKVWKRSADSDPALLEEQLRASLKP